MDLRVGGPSCTGSAAVESTDIGAIHYCFIFLNFCSALNHSARNASGVEKRDKILHFKARVK